MDHFKTNHTLQNTENAHQKLPETARPTRNAFTMAAMLSQWPPSDRKTEEIKGEINIFKQLLSSKNGYQMKDEEPNFTMLKKTERVR